MNELIYCKITVFPFYNRILFYFCNSKACFLRNFFTNNVNSVLATISLHLLLVILFLWFKLGEAHEEHKEQVMIEFNPQIKPLEDKAEKTEKAAEGEMEKTMPKLSSGEVHSIAANVSSKLEDKISTSKYEQQVMQELGISSLKNENKSSTQPPAPDENAIDKAEQENNMPDNGQYVPNVIRKENTTVSYFLDNRWHRYLYIPTYKCQGGGTVIIDIVINQSGNVISATIAENKSTRDQCLLEEAYHSATTAVFNSDSKSPTKQIGTITYVFLAQ
jgi:hypothetical protein